ncbi:MAG: hypothetical protein R8F63_21340 [Acidimicrobiales bacterium]|nr:hypothetical protein [Acidimicrobiales bacterium]
MPGSVAPDCSAPFDPDWTLERLSRAGLARLCREYQMLSMFHDRALMPHVAGVGGTEGTVTLADGEWMGSSPIYTRRNLANIGATGETVSSIAKGVQFDIGGPDHFLDFRFEVVSDTELFFYTEFCGPHDHLVRMTGNDHDTVKLMCHDMEDRTFDATFSATNPRARCEPVYRPPRPDDFTGHHCRWRLWVDEEAAGAPPPNPSLAFMETTRAAAMDFAIGESHEPGGLVDYSGPLLDWFRLEEFGHAFLVRQAKEYALDVHLLMRAAYWTVEQHWGADFLADAAPQHRAAFAPGLVTRLRDAMGIVGDDIEAIAKIIQIDPVHVPDYTAFRVEVEDGEILVALGECEALHDDPRSPLGLLTSTPDRPGFEHMAQAVNPRAQVCVDTPPDGAVAAWRVWIDPAADPVEPHPLVDMVNLNDITTFDLSARPATPVEITPRG